MGAGNTLNSRGSNGSKSSLTSLEVRFAQSPLSGSRRRLIREILDNHEQTFFLSSREMAKRYNVDAATIDGFVPRVAASRTRASYARSLISIVI